MINWVQSSSYSSPYPSISCIFPCAPQVVYLSQGYPVGNTHFVTIYFRFSRPLTLGNTHFVTESRRFSRPLTLSNTLVTESCSFSHPPHYPSPAQTLAFSFPAQMLLCMSFLLLFLLSLSSSPPAPEKKTDQHR